MIKTIPQAIDDMAVSLGASPSAEIPTVAQALENVYTALGGTRTDLDTLVVSEVIDLVAPLIQGGGGGGGVDLSHFLTVVDTSTAINGEYIPSDKGDHEETVEFADWLVPDVTELVNEAGFIDGFTVIANGKTLTFPIIDLMDIGDGVISTVVDGWGAKLKIVPKTETTASIILSVIASSDWRSGAKFNVEVGEVMLVTFTQAFADIIMG